MRRKSIEEVISPGPDRADRVHGAEIAYKHVHLMQETGHATPGDVMDIAADYAQEFLDSRTPEELHDLQKSGELSKWEDIARSIGDDEDGDEVSLRRSHNRARVHGHLIGKPVPRREAAVREPEDRRSPDDQVADYTRSYDRKRTKRR